jgi:prolipoprotein diacylglyceryltransferase
MQPIIPNPSRGGSFFFSALALLGPPRIYFEYLRTDHVHPICGCDSRRKALTCSVIQWFGVLLHIASLFVMKMPRKKSELPKR